MQVVLTGRQCGQSQLREGHRFVDGRSTRAVVQPTGHDGAVGVRHDVAGVEVVGGAGDNRVDRVLVVAGDVEDHHHVSVGVHIEGRTVGEDNRARYRNNAVGTGIVLDGEGRTGQLQIAADAVGIQERLRARRVGNRTVLHRQEEIHRLVVGQQHRV